MPAGPKLPRMPRQSPASFFASRVQMAVTRAAQVGRGQVVNHAHEADPYDPNSHHCANSLRLSPLWLFTFFVVCSFCTVFTPFFAPFFAPVKPGSDAFYGVVSLAL